MSQIDQQPIDFEEFLASLPTSLPPISEHSNGSPRRSNDSTPRDSEGYGTRNRSDGSSSNRGRRWCFTLNNPTDPEKTVLSQVHDDPDASVRYIVYQYERGENGTVHAQGYCEFTKPCRLGRVKRILGLRGHFEPARGSADQNRTYCTKEDSRIEGPFENGQPGRASQGERNDLLNIKKAVDEGMPDPEIWDNHFCGMVKFHRGIAAYKLVKAVKRNWKTKLIVCFGSPGTGKSRYAMDNYPDAYWKQRGTWFDLYNNHDTVVIDDFYGWLPFDTLLRMCDRYPMMVETKGGHVNFCPKTIIMTSNQAPDEWYRNIPNYDAFVRRVDNFMHFSDSVKEFTVYSEFITSIRG